MGLKRKRSALFAAFAVILIPALSLGREVRITILHTADLRGHVLSLRHREHAEYLGGLLRCASVIRNVRAEQPNVLLIDCGDLLSGSPESALGDGTLALEAANALQYDARIPGGNDWGGGIESVAQRERLTRIPLVASNIQGGSGPESVLLNHRRWLEREMDGVRILIAGLADAPSQLAAEFQMADPLSAMADLLPELRKRSPDILVLAAHYPVHAKSDAPSLLQEIARTYPELDVILAGGGGMAVRGARVGETVCSQADAEGRWLGRVDLVFDTVARTLIRRSTDLIEIGPHIPEDDLLLQALGHRLGRIERQLQEIVGEASSRVEGSSDWPGQSGIQALVSRSVSDGQDIDVVLLGKEGGGYLAQGNILRKDIMRAIPDVQQWAKLSVLPAELRQILSENTVFLGTPSLLGVHGLRYSAVTHPEGAAEIKDLLLDEDRKPHGRERLHILCNAALLEPNIEGREQLRRTAADPRVRLEFLPIDTRQAVVEYVRRNRPLSVRPQRGMTIIVPDTETP